MRLVGECFYAAALTLVCQSACKWAQPYVGSSVMALTSYIVGPQNWLAANHLGTAVCLMKLSPSVNNQLKLSAAISIQGNAGIASDKPQNSLKGVLYPELGRSEAFSFKAQLYSFFVCFPSVPPSWMSYMSLPFIPLFIFWGWHEHLRNTSPRGQH